MTYIAFVTLIYTICLIHPVVTFYIPGVAPLDFRKGDTVEVKVRMKRLFGIDVKILFSRLLK